MGTTENSPDPSPRAASALEQFQALSRQHAEDARAFVRKKLGRTLRRRVDSDDVLQEVLLEASKLFLEKEGAASMAGRDFVPWLFTIIEHKIKNLSRIHVAAGRRSVKREVPFEQSGGASNFPSAQRTPSAELAAAERAEALRRAIEELPPREREVVRLVHLEKFKVNEAAESMGKTPNATSVLLHHALRRLREILKRKGNFLS